MIILSSRAGPFISWCEVPKQMEIKEKSLFFLVGKPIKVSLCEAMGAESDVSKMDQNNSVEILPP